MAFSLVLGLGKVFYSYCGLRKRFDSYASWQRGLWLMSPGKGSMCIGSGQTMRGKLRCHSRILPFIDTDDCHGLSFGNKKYNADYDLSAKEGADTLAPTGGETAACIVDVTRRWNAENITFPLNFLLPNHIHNQQLERLRLVRGDPTLEPGHQLEKLYHDMLECMNLLSHRLGLHKFFFKDSPSSLDAYVFGHLAPLLKVKLPNGKLHQHLNSQDNLRHYCTNGLVLYFPSEGGGKVPGVSVYSDGSDFDNEPNKQRNQILSVLFAMGSMLGYAILMGIVSIQHV
uniref:Metaxin glutathione S-transferase domain-containing protein n=1 Tax=Oncorhynchus mykiss TaxID=8022 RepID=A0A8C7RDX2_ONCMY